MVRYFLMLIFISHFLFSCGRRQIHANIVEGVDFKKYKTYAWLMPTDEHLANSILNENVHYFVNREMHLRGFVADSVSPDLLMDYRVGVQKQELITLQPAYPITPLPRPLWHPGATFREHVPVLKYYEEGVLTLDVYEREGDKHLWSAWSVEPQNQQMYSGRNISSLIRRLFRKFPLSR